MTTIVQRRKPVGDSLRPELQVAMLAAADRLMNEGLEPIAALRELTDLLGGNFDYRGHMLHNHTAAEDAVFQLLMCLHATLEPPARPN
jgi:hypothetical protein